MTYKEVYYNILKKNKNIVCYGVGKRFQKYIKLLENDHEFVEKVICCVDRNSEKQGTSIRLKNKTIPVYSLDYLRNHEDIVLFITNVRYDEVLLDLRKEFRGIEFFCVSYLWAEMKEQEAMGKYVPEILRLTDKPVIPKKIHYCWFGKNPLPERYKNWMESWKKYCPDYEIIEWNESNYDITKNKYMFEAYQNKKWGFVPDYARLDIIYNHGGIYLDTDVELIKSLDDLLYQKAFMGFESNENVALGLGFGAVKKLPLLKILMKDYENREFINKDGTLNMVASPVIQTQSLMNEGLKLNGEYQILDGVTIYPSKVLSGKNNYSRRICCDAFTKAIHHYEASWVQQDIREFNEQFEKAMNFNDMTIAYGYL